MFYNGKTEMTKTDVKYVGNKVSIVSLDIPIDCTYDQLLATIYSRTSVRPEKFQFLE